MIGRRSRVTLALAVLGILLAVPGLASAQYDADVEGVTEEASDEEATFLDATKFDSYDGLIEPGSLVLFHADGFGSETKGVLELRSERVTLLFWVADDEGVMDATARIPEDAPHGRHSLVAVGEDPQGELREVSMEVEIGVPGSDGGVDWVPVSGGIAGFVVAALVVALFIKRSRGEDVAIDDETEGAEEGLTL